MKKRITYTVISFLSVLFIHFAYSVWQIIETASKWKQVNEVNPYWQYFERQEFFLGLSFALTAAFTAYAITNFFEKRKLGIAGTVGGLTLAGVLYFAGCFLTGCCGSPMLAVYLSLFGSSILGFAKPLTAGLTAISVVVGFVWISKNNKTKVCSVNDVCCSPKDSEVSEEQSSENFIMKNENNNTIDIEAVNKINSEMEEGIELLKCQQCGCMEETLEILKSDFPTEVDKWKKKMIPIKYSCLGCAHCYPAVAMNLFNEAFPEKAAEKLECAFEVKEDKWPYVAGEYYAFCGGDYGNSSLRDCPVAVSTLGDSDLADRLAKNHPDELCIVGKTETENIGVDKVIKNTITNTTIKYLLLVGQEPKGHKSGETFVELSKNGVDEKMRVIGSTGKKPILRNVSVEEIDSFRKQVEVVDMIGCSDDNLIINKIKELAVLVPLENEKSLPQKSDCGCSNCNDDESVELSDETAMKKVELIKAKEPSNIIMDKAGYFVILPIPEKNIINVEHYSYDNTLLRVIEGKDARSIYWTIIENKWVTFLSHASYLGKELEKAELSLKLGFKYVQDGA